MSKKVKKEEIKLEVIEDPYAWDPVKDGGPEVLLRQIVEELVKDLPPKKHLEGILDQADISNWIDAKLNLLSLLEDTVIIMGGRATHYKREELAKWVYASRELIRQTEESALRYLRTRKKKDLIEFVGELDDKNNHKWSAVV